MKKNRLEAFSDGVIAIIITIMVLEMKVPARRRPAGAHAGAAGIPQLPAELRLRGYLLEQPSPHVPGGPVGEWRCVMGEPASVVLVVAAAVYHRLDGREPLRALADDILRPQPAFLRLRVFDSADLYYSTPRARLTPSRGRGERFQRQDLPGVVRSGHRLGMADPCLDRHGVFRVHGVDVAGARPAHGAGSRRTYETILLMRAV